MNKNYTFWYIIVILKLLTIIYIRVLLYKKIKIKYIKMQFVILMENKDILGCI